jgi:hypothetical protein
VPNHPPRGSNRPPRRHASDVHRLAQARVDVTAEARPGKATPCPKIELIQGERWLSVRVYDADDESQDRLSARHSYPSACVARVEQPHEAAPRAHEEDSMDEELVLGAEEQNVPGDRLALERSDAHLRAPL